MYLDDDFFKAYEKKEVYDFNGHAILTDEDLKEVTWDWMVDFIDTYPKKLCKIIHEKIGWNLLDLQLQDNRPLWVKKIGQELEEAFPDKLITCIGFGGFSDQHLSFDHHMDSMSVLYVQALGEIEWSNFEPLPNAQPIYSHDKGASLKPHELKRIYSDWFYPGRAIYVPAGVYHHVKPYTTRAGFSFGIEPRRAI